MVSGRSVWGGVRGTGVDPTHPDWTGRVFGDVALSLTDTDGHGTQVAGIIAGSGAMSTSVTNARGSINPGVAGQYRGKAPGAKLFSQSIELHFGPASDRLLQESAARTNVFIS